LPFLLLSFLLSFKLLFFFCFGIFREFLEVNFAAIDYDLFSFFLIGEKVCIPSQESKDTVEKSIDISGLLYNGHKDSIVSGVV
jgi:hypothetical protein